jgi:predicted dehydrogenase
MPFRMALFGAGKWARNIVRVLQARGDVTLEAVLVNDTQKPRDWLGTAPVYDDPEKLLKSHALDGVIICTPAASHADLCIRALGAGLPCFVEKPATLSLADMQRIRAAAEAADLPVVVDYIHLYSAPFQDLLKALKTRPRPKKIVALAGNTVAAVRDCSILWDWGAHDVAMTVACLGNGDASVDRADAWPRGNASFDSLRLQMDWDGVRVRFRFSQELARKARAYVVQYEDEILLYTDLPAHTLSRWRRRPGGRFNGASREILSSGGANPLNAALDSFIDKATKRTLDRDALSCSVEVTRILELCERHLSA